MKTSDSLIRKWLVISSLCNLIGENEPTEEPEEEQEDNIFTDSFLVT